MGEQGPQGEIGPQGTQGDAGCPGPQGDQGPMGPTGLKGNTGATGAAPAIAIGNVSSGLIPEVTADQADTGITLNFILPIGPTGPQGDQGIQGEQGPQGAMGNTGPKGDTGAVPIVTVGTVISGSNADVKAISTEDGVSLDFTLPAGPTGPAGEKGDAGPQGEPGDTGPRGLTGASPTIGVGGVTSGDNPEVTADPTAAGIELNFVLPVGPAGPQGEKGDPGEQGPQGNQGDTGPQGPVGAVPTVEVGTVSSGNDADVKANPTENGVTLDFVLPIGPVGPKGDQGLIGETGPQGEKGITGPTGATGPAPEISVSEDTAMSYKLSFKSGQQEIVSSNLRQAIEYHNADLSTTGRTLNVTIGKLVLIYAYVNTSSISIAIRPANLSQSVLADIRRTSIYDSASIESQTNNDTKVSASLTLDGTVYSQSQETHWMRIRQQDPDSGLWSMCEVTSFISARGARTSVCVEWLYTDCSF
ncbi:collagen-like protein [Clostridium sp. MCC353]|uniref:collagen-like protein n=1 Tax=Clostridium sp. MCC353 TaxID=2592646 RepID=UPI00207A9030|nr:collagen-like protein [Clostridium sp. MCC353]